MRKTALCGVAMASLFVLAVPGNVRAERPVDHFRINIGPETFDNNICGVDGVSVLRGHFVATVFADNTLRGSFMITQTFTAAASGKAVVEHIATHEVSLVDPIANGDGTVTFVQSVQGLPHQFRLLNGRLLICDAGTSTVAATFTVDEDGNIIDFVSQSISGVHGPHPSLTDPQHFCDVIIDALT